MPKTLFFPPTKIDDIITPPPAPHRSTLVLAPPHPLPSPSHPSGPRDMNDSSATPHRPVSYERGDAKVVFGKNGMHSLWDASLKLGVGISSLLEINGGSDIVQPGQEMRVPRELILRGAKGLGSTGTGAGAGAKRGGRDGVDGESNDDRGGGVGPVWRGEKVASGRSRAGEEGGGDRDPFSHREADDVTFQLPFPLVGAAAAAREDWSIARSCESSLIAGPPDRPDLLLTEPELDRLADAKPHFRDFLAALRWVETANQMPAPDGDDGASIGPFQISREYHQDAWNPTGDPVEGRRLDREYWRCDEIEYSERTVVRFMCRWCPWALRHGDYETLARVHNAGPGYRDATNETGRYWWRVRCRAPHLMFGVARSPGASGGPSAGLAREAAPGRWPRGLPLSGAGEFDKPPKFGGGVGGGWGGGGEGRVLGVGLGHGVTLRARVKGDRVGGFWRAHADGGGGSLVSVNDVALQLPPKLAVVVGLTLGWPQKIIRATFLGNAGASARD